MVPWCGAHSKVEVEGSSIGVVVMDHSRSMAQQLTRSLLINLPETRITVRLKLYFPIVSELKYISKVYGLMN